MSDAGSIAAGDLELARQFAYRLAQKYESRLFRVILFGSHARGEGNQESDLDLFVALDPKGGIKEAARRIACDLTLEHGLLVSVFVADRECLDRHRGFAFVKAVQRDGVAV